MPTRTGLGDLSPSQLGLLSKLRMALPYVQMTFSNNLIAMLHLSRAPPLEAFLNEVVAFLNIRSAFSNGPPGRHRHGGEGEN
jgi:hypothetical protein